MIEGYVQQLDEKIILFMTISANHINFIQMKLEKVGNGGKTYTEINKCNVLALRAIGQRYT